MRNLDILGIRFIIYRLEHIAKKLFTLVLLVFLSFSAEKEKSDIRLAQAYFYRGYIQYNQGNYRDAMAEFFNAYLSDREGYYGELAYLYIGISYANLSYKVGERGGVYSAIGFLNMYPYHYKRPTYLFLQREFIGQAYMFLGLYDRSKDIFLNLHRDTLREDYLLNFLYADSLSKALNSYLLKSINPENLAEKKYLYYLVKGFYAFNFGDYNGALADLSEANQLNRYLEEDPDFLYRYAVSSFMMGDWRRAIFYFEMLDRRDIYKKYEDSLNYYLAIIYLTNKNYADAKKRIENLIRFGGVKADLLVSQLWIFPEFLEKYKESFKDYRKTLESIAWRYLNSSYSIPALLGIYYYILKEKKIENEHVLKLKDMELIKEISFNDIRVNTKDMLEVLNHLMGTLNPYGKEADFLIELYSINPRSYGLLFGYEKLARAITYLGRVEMKKVVENLGEPLKGFLMGQLILLEGSEEGIKMIEESSKFLTGEDKKEALFILGIYKEPKLLEGLVNEDLSNRLKPYLEPALLRLGDFYYFRRDYNRAKEYYKMYLERAQESDLYWITAYRLAKAGEFTGDRETIDWVVKKSEGKDNIISRVIIALWGF